MIQKSALLNKYLEQYKRRPTSRVFAPLAETYRKLGMHDEAFKILKEGIRFNPTYPLGYIILAHCYFDLQNYDHAYDVIRPFVKTNLDNISLQKLFAQICEKLGLGDEALDTYKYLLFINPKDEVIAERVMELEKENFLEEPSFESEEESFISDEEDWVQVSFAEKEISDPSPEESEEDNWQMETSESFEENKKTALDKFKEDLESETELLEPNLDDEYYYEDFDNEEEEVLEDIVSEEPIITHTLVDLYLKQNHYQKAIEFLESILKLHPHDQATINKLAEVQALSANGQHEHEEEDDNVQGDHEKLLSLVEKSQEFEKAQIQKVKTKLDVFLTKVKSEAGLRGY